MATYDISLGGVLAAPPQHGRSVNVHSAVVDFGFLRKGNQKITAANGDVFQFLKIPEAAWALVLYWQISKVATAAGTITGTIEDGGGVLLAATSLKAVGRGAVALNKTYANGDTLFTTLVGDPGDARLKVSISYIPFALDAGDIVGP